MYLAFSLLCQQSRSFTEQTTSVVNLLSMSHWESPKEMYDVLLQCHFSFLLVILVSMGSSLIDRCSPSVFIWHNSHLLRSVIASRNDDNWSFLTSCSVVAVRSWRLNGGCCSEKRQQWWLDRFCCLSFSKSEYGVSVWCQCRSALWNHHTERRLSYLEPRTNCSNRVLSIDCSLWSKCLMSTSSSSSDRLANIIDVIGDASYRVS